MENKFVTYTIGSEKDAKTTFYVGDVCGILTDEVYDNVWGKNNYSDGKFEVPAEISGIDHDSSFALSKTKYGDGAYEGKNTGYYYGVDSGTFGIIPDDITRNNNFIKQNFLNHIVASCVSMNVYEDGTFEIYADGNLFDTIMTGFIGEDKEDCDDDYDNE